MDTNYTMRPVYEAPAIAARVRELGAAIDACYKGEPLVCVCVLKGALPFFTDLVRAMDNENVRVECVRLASYGDSDTSSGTVRMAQDVEGDVAGQHVLVVEDIVDSGHSMAFFLEHLRNRGARSVRLAALVDKRERREADVTVDFAGFVLSEGFLVGYGMDYAERWRSLPGIYKIEGEIAGD